MGSIIADELMQAQAQLWTHIFNHIDSMSLKCAVELGIPDAIHAHDNPAIPIAHLLSALSLSPSKQPHLRRLMRMLANSGIFAETEPDTYSLTPLSTLLLTDHPNSGSSSLSGFVLAMLQPNMVDPFQSMSSWFRTENEQSTPCSVHFGCGIWDIANKEPMFNKLFNQGMESDTKFLMNVLLKDCGHVFEGVESLVDVGGGTGSVAMAISEAYPNMSCSVLELCHVVDTVKEKGDVHFHAGDMFKYIPPADAILLKWICHDWGDEDCVKILRRCREAIASRINDRGKVIIIDMVMGSSSDGNGQKARTAQLYMDVLMMTVPGGIERGEKEWEKLFIEAGFSRYKIMTDLCLRSVIEVYP